MGNPTNVLEVHTYTLSDFESYYYIRAGIAKIWVHPKMIKRTATNMIVQFPRKGELKSIKEPHNYILTFGTSYIFLVASPCSTKYLKEISIHSDYKIRTPQFPIWISGKKYPTTSACLVATRKTYVIYSVENLSTKYKMLQDGTIEEYFPMDFSEIKEKLELKEG